MGTHRAIGAAALALTLVLGGGRSLHSAYGTDVRLSTIGFPGDSVRHLLRTGHSGFPFALRAVVGDSERFRKVWAEAVSGDLAARPVPEIDFKRKIVIVAAMGSRPSTGFGITVDSVVARGSTLEVHVRLGSAGSLCIQGAAMTSPVDIVEVARSEATVTFHDRNITAECKIP